MQREERKMKGKKERKPRMHDEGEGGDVGRYGDTGKKKIKK